MSIGLFASSLAQIDCTTKPDGIYGTGCRSYTNCTGGSGVIVDCDPGYVLDYEEGRCRQQELVPPPCGIDDDCSTLHDGKYPVMPDCKYFFTCQGGANLGSSPCNDPPTSGEKCRFKCENGSLDSNKTTSIIAKHHFPVEIRRQMQQDVPKAFRHMCRS